MSEAPDPDPPASRLLLLLALLSGLGGLVHELLYLRLLTSFLGDLFSVHVAVVSTFLVALGAGALIAHRVVDRLWLFEVALGLHALAFPYIVRAYQGSALSRSVSDPGLASLVAAVVLLAFPAMCVGLSVPAFSACLAPRLGDNAFRRVYVAYNVAAACGLLGVEFHLVRHLGLQWSLALVGVLNVGVGVVLLRARRRLLSAPRDAAPPPSLGTRTVYAFFLASAMSGVFTGLFFRAAYAAFHPGRENFALCTAALLLVLAAGTLVGERLRLSFARCLALGAVTVAATFLLLPVLCLPYVNLARLAELYGPWGPWLRQGPLASLFPLGTALLLAAPYLFLGATIPSLLRGIASPGRRSGELLFLSGLANAAGSAFYVLALHPGLPYFSVVVLAVGGLVAAALLAGGLRRADVLLLTSAAGLVPLLAGMPESIVYTSFQAAPGSDIRVFKSGPDDATVVRQGGVTRIHYDGLPEIQVTQAGTVNPAEVTVGLSSAFFAPRRDRALVIGLGSGVTAGTVGTLFRQTDVVDLNRAMFSLAEDLRSANFAIVDNPAVTLHHDDGRRWLSRSGTRYDLITNTVSTPRYFAAAKVYTVEFFDLVKQALAEDGVYTTWFAAPDTSPEGSRILLASLQDRFRHCSLTNLRNMYYLAACSDRPLVPRPLAPGGVAPAVEQALRVALDLPPMAVDEYLAAIVVSRDAFARHPLQGVPLNRDDLPALEFALSPESNAWDPIERNPEQFNVDLGADPSLPGFLERALVMQRVHASFFDRYFQPHLRADPALLAAFQSRARPLPRP